MRICCFDMKRGTNYSKEKLVSAVIIIRYSHSNKIVSEQAALTGDPAVTLKCSRYPLRINLNLMAN